ncbi:MAG: hypothetical protein LBM12_03015 [Candidatus Nomurabacteria bacterium]|jgi:hypothetical protein|nr:hypothetical protein [Candidatus Nomurabacteria bacterium]
MKNKQKGSMKKQIIGTMLASAVILAAVGATGVVNDRMSAATDVEISVEVLPSNVSYEITDPVNGATITDPNYALKVRTIRNASMKFYNCYGSQIADCGKVMDGYPNGVGYISATTINNPDEWSNIEFNASFLRTEQGQHRLMVIGFDADDVAVDQGTSVYVNYVYSNPNPNPPVNPNPPAPEPAKPTLTVEVVGGTEKDGAIVLPKGDNIQIKVSYSDIAKLGVGAGDKDLTGSCQPIPADKNSGMITCTIPKKDLFNYIKEGNYYVGRMSLVLFGKDKDGNVLVTKTINLVDISDIDAPNTGLNEGFLAVANEDLFLGGVVALLAMGLMTVYILFRRANKA